MEVYWTLKAQNDLERIYHFACQYSKSHANNVLDHLIISTTDLALQPKIGIPQPRYKPREVRKVLFSDYEVHYEISNDTIYIVDLWHTREKR
ncbi:type II toxin-antitoxin system RelE/ParE family toxin [Photorhabdus laumondii]|uniref:Plasmid stabilization system protein n=1 Tax=Photorhabdus laumondii subsp. clarkei TaxID=2029685 RepID=A0A329VE65_9GAMM|nr:type II toxin-antitoxin system RelE/ParE family toxin [Photorhabdus laumondii]RAW89818.1 plasmid stabilization system protein [Photorhabdus laumondii subsp. clarkei]